MSTSFQINLLRKKATSRDSAEKDDIILAKREGGNVVVFYKDRLSKKDMTLRLTQIGLPDYLRMLFHSLSLDEDPSFASIQISAPGFPPILVSMETLADRGSLRDTIYDMARAAQDHWFADEPASLDSSSDSSSDSEDEYEDLPPLIPVADCCPCAGVGPAGARCWLNARDYI